jgi:hypothetical protein
MRRDLVAVGFLVVGCSLTSLESLDDNVGATPTLDSGVGGTGGAGGTGGGSNACVPSCERAVQAGCPGFTQQKCLAECQAKGESIAAECVSAYGALLLCAGETGSYICDGDGNAALITCNDEANALAACSGSSTGGTGGTDGGNVDAGACDPGPYLNVTCAELSTQNQSCTDCVVAQCCAEFDACFADPACAGLYSCAANCSTRPDFSQCITDTCAACAVAVETFNAANQCVTDHCSGQCGGA